MQRRSRARSALFAAAATALVAVAGCSDDGEAATPVAPLEDTAVDEVDGDGAGLEVVPEVVADLQPSIVTVFAGASEGSGVVYDDSGVIVTNAHVVAGAETVEVALATGEQLDADVVASAPRSDLAVLRVDRRLPAAEFSDDLPRVGELAIAMGNPLGFENSVTAGIVSGLSRAVPGAAQSAPALVDLVQTDAPISPGSSGGALVDGRGEVIGINVAYLPPNPPGARGAVSIGFAIPAPTAVAVVEQLLEDGTVTYPYLGLQPGALTPQIRQALGIEREEGVLVLDVVDGAPAESAGIRSGDLLVGIGRDPLASVEDLLAALRRFDPGDEVVLHVVRDGEELELDVTLGETPETG